MSESDVLEWEEGMWIKFDKRRVTFHPHLSDEEVGLLGVLNAQGGEQGEEETGRIKYQTKLQKI